MTILIVTLVTTCLVLNILSNNDLRKNEVNEESLNILSDLFFVNNVEFLDTIETINSETLYTGQVDLNRVVSVPKDGYIYIKVNLLANNIYFEED